MTFALENSFNIRTISSNDFPVVDQVLADAFADDPLSRRLFGEKDPRSALIRMNRRAIRNKYSRGIVAEQDGQIIGAYIESDWPKCEPHGMSAVGATWDMLVSMRLRFFSAIGLFSKVEKSHPQWAHRHLTVLGVTPEKQGQGVGASLLKKFCDDADAAGAGCYLETETDGAQRLYERFGFRVVGSAKSDGIVFRFMWRQPVEPDGSLTRSQ